MDSTLPGPSPNSHADAVDAATSEADDRVLPTSGRDVRPVAHRADNDRPLRSHLAPHYHDEPSLEAQRAAEVALLFMGSAFLCTFVVVVLDGACEIGAHAGYYY